MVLVFTHLVAEELVEVPQLVGVGDLSVQRGVPLLGDSGGAADLNGGVSAQTFNRALSMRLGVGPGGRAG